VFFATPVMRQVARIELPSTREAVTAARFSAVSLFILTLMPDRSGMVKLLCQNVRGRGGS
jgi:hypothetical protein